MNFAPALRVTAAVALALQSGCAVAPSPSAPEASPASTSPTPTPAPSAAAGDAPVLIAWQAGGDGSELLVVGANAGVERLSLPVAPNGPLAAGLHGPLYFLAGSAADPILWTSEGSLSEPRWTSRQLFPPKLQEEPLAWLCAGPGDPPGTLAVQSSDNLVYLVDDGGRLRLLPPGRLFLRPGGCAWSDAGHLLVPADEAGMLHHIAFAMLRVDDGTSRLLDGVGGEQPAVSDVSLAYVARDRSTGNVVLVGAIPTPDAALSPATGHLEPGGGAAFFRPVLSADGRRLAVVELDARGRPTRLLLFDLTGGWALTMELDVRGAEDAGPVWVANPPAG